MTDTLDGIILSSPSLLPVAPASTTPAGSTRSWIQIARTGNFVSTRYGQFSITAADLAQMLRNFNEVTPRAPTELPVDYDHISMDPKRPGDGIAAGWMKRLELRAEGSELWADVEWTPTAAKQIAAKEYRFVSPSFVKEHTHKDGTKIGTTLLAAAITNHPFLESMKALTLFNFDAMGDLGMSDGSKAAAPVHLAEIEQRVSFLSDAECTPELTDEERAQTFLVKSTIGEGDDQFVRLTTLDGIEFGWFRALQLAPASSPKKNQNNPLPEKTTEEITTMRAQTANEIEKKAAAYALRVTTLANDRSMRDAISLANAEDAEGAEAYRLAGIGAEVVENEPAPVPLDLSVRSDESFDQLAMRYATEKKVSLRDAVHEVGLARPDLAATR